MLQTHRVLSIAGAVEAPRVVAVDLAWVALWGGVVVDRSETIGALVEACPTAARLLLVLPAGHALLRRARLPLTASLRQLQSACASCGACAPACSSGVQVSTVLRVLGRSRSARLPLAALETASACTGCGACDLACPVGLSPMRLVGEMAQRFSAPIATRALRTLTLDPHLAQARAGLACCARPPLTLQPG